VPGTGRLEQWRYLGIATRNEFLFGALLESVLTGDSKKVRERWRSRQGRAGSGSDSEVRHPGGPVQSDCANLAELAAEANLASPRSGRAALRLQRELFFHAVLEALNYPTPKPKRVLIGGEAYQLFPAG